MNPNHKKQLSVAFLLAPNFTLSTFSAFIDVLRLAADEGDRSRPIQCSWVVLEPEMRAVKASCGVEISASATLNQPEQYDYIIVVGGLLHGRTVSRPVVDFLKRAAKAHIPLIGLCTGSFILARAGLMEGYRSCISWFHRTDFESEFPHLEVSSDQLFIIDRDRLTGAGGISVVHLAAYLVERHCGKAEALKALRILIEDAPLPSVTPQPQPLLTEEVEDVRVRKAMLLIERNLATPLPLEQIAEHVHISIRQLERLFRAETGMGPSAFAIRLRLHNAHSLLVSTNRAILEIALECGFLSNSHFTNSFRSAYGRTPSQVREERQARSCLA